MQENKKQKGSEVPSELFKTAVNQKRTIQRIRARASYILFRELYGFLEEKPAIADILRKLYDILDGRCSFGSRKNAEYAEESLDWVLKDKGG
ncbi:MAG: hypothetical protein ACYTBV_17885 [Planctomycetota bacterium]|jgi:hypothetical protein